MEQKKLKVALILNNYDVHAWTYKMIENIQNSHFAEISLVMLIKNTKSYENSKISLMRKILSTLYKKIIERNTYLPNAFSKKNALNLFSKTESIDVLVTEEENGFVVEGGVIEKINAYDLDVIFDDASMPLNDSLLKSAKNGVWAFGNGEYCEKRGGPKGFWESMTGASATGSYLEILSKDVNNGKVLCQSFSCTDVMSIQDTNSTVAWKSLSFMTRKLSDLYDLGSEEFLKKNSKQNYAIFYSNKISKEPSDLEFMKLLIGKLIEKVKVLWANKRYFNQWILLFDMSEELSTSMSKYKKLIPPKDRFWADPHVIYQDNKYYIFIEELPYKTNKGHLSVITMDEEGNYGKPEMILEKPYHLSYPFIFDHEGQYYMIPETMDNNTIDLYVCTQFPNKWKFKMTLMDNVKGVDATVIYHQDKWWMFVNMVETEGASSWDELFLFSADDILSQDWTPHPLNPIVSDCSVSRPAGKIFIEDGVLYRPSQNCSIRYGYGFNINKIIQLDEKQYKEETISRIKPNWDDSLVGTHTFSREKSLHVIDALYKRRR